MKIVSSKVVQTHIISGFLGAGKTTLLQNILQQKPEHEIWAVLMNEFGQIGIDQQLLPQSTGYEVKELLGGCLCCSSQLPLQITLSKLIQEKQPDRLFIEPTGLGHPSQLLEQLTEPHWQSQLQMNALITVIDGSRLHDSAWTQQSLYQDQLKAAQIIVVSHTNNMSTVDEECLEQFKQDYVAYIQKWILAEQGQVNFADINLPYTGIVRKIQPLLHIQRRYQQGEQYPEVKQLPYHYVETTAGYTVVGWKFSKRWQFNFYDLFDVLSEQQHWLRIKGIFNTDQGWMVLNFNPEQLNYKSSSENIDNRVEIITQYEGHWDDLEQQILNCRIDS